MVKQFCCQTTTICFVMPYDLVKIYWYLRGICCLPAVDGSVFQHTVDGITAKKTVVFTVTIFGI